MRLTLCVAAVVFLSCSVVSAESTPLDVTPRIEKAEAAALCSLSMTLEIALA
jgi:hypothetical protein